jgi:Spy/CpxP family protein refolding chaperone
MTRLRVLLTVAAFALIGGLLLGDDPKKPTDPKPDTTPKTTNHTLPQGWKQLGLSDDQKKKIYAIEDDYTPKIAALKKQIEELSTEEKGKKYAVLTDDQKKHLKEIREAGDGGGKPGDKKEDPKKDESKKDDSKKDDKKP